MTEMGDIPAPVEVTIDEEGLISPCFCGPAAHRPYCRIGVLIAHMDRPKHLFRVTAA